MSTHHVALDIFHVPTSKIPNALFRMGLHRMNLRRIPELKFWKLLGTGSGRTFTMRDADLHHWAILTVWNTQDSADNFASHDVVQSWNAIATEHARIVLLPISSKGTWASQKPFGDPTPRKVETRVAALTRASIKVRWWREFWRSVPAVSADLNSTDGLLMSIGIGEAPVGLQGTFSVWRDNDSITQFATRQSPHQKVISRTHETGWYAEELFARFEVVSMSGTFENQNWTDPL
ncbi:MAG: monooxygenase [Actinomycetes bacterium]